MSDFPYFIFGVVVGFCIFAVGFIVFALKTYYKNKEKNEEKEKKNEKKKK